MHSQTLEDYIRAVYLLDVKEIPFFNSCKLRSNLPEKKRVGVKSRELADYLQVKKSSVSEMVGKLKQVGMLNYEKYSRLSLTKKGRELAERLTFKHRVIEAFLTKLLKRDKKKVHNEAHKLEHAFSDESIKRIYAIIGKPTVGAHGEVIPIVKL